MYKALGGKFADLDGPDKTCLAISKSKFFGKIAGLQTCEYTEADYPEHNMMSLQFPDDGFDFCISDQVLEHIEGDPFIAFNETVRVTKPGGYICHTTCFLNEVHGVPKDFWRYTTTALDLLAKSSGCVDIETS